MKMSVIECTARYIVGSLVGGSRVVGTYNIVPGKTQKAKISYAEWMDIFRSLSQILTRCTALFFFLVDERTF